MTFPIIVQYTFLSPPFPCIAPILLCINSRGGLWSLRIHHWTEGRRVLHKRDILTLHTHTPHSHSTLTFHTQHSTFTLHTHTPHSHCTLTLYTYTPYLNSILTLHTHTHTHSPYSHSILTLHTHTPYLHSTLTLPTHSPYSHCILTL